MAENEQDGNAEEIQKVSGLFKEWFLDYASYVILERAIPSIFDGLKPVQRRILHSMRELEDGRYNKVANIVGNTMKYHPHGDMAITDAMVQIGQKELLIDTQGNWGNILTGDGAAASRYIEARLTPFALEVVFNPKTTEWSLSYDGRNKEPVNLPMKFPLLLAQGVEGIAVGLSTKIMPHNFNELIDASIKVLQNKKFTLYPDFQTGGMIDVSQYNEGKRGGKIRVRSKIEQTEKNVLTITEIPYGTNTSNLIENILKANDKGKIKIKKIEDNTAENVEINIFLPTGVSPDRTLDALYAFTDCEVSISPNACVIVGDKPEFLSINDILEKNTFHTLDLLKLELEIALNELQEQWHFASLERIFIDNRIYHDIEEEETWEGVIEAIDKGLKPHTKHLLRAVTRDDILRLTEIRIKRISKFDLDKAQQNIEALEGRIAEVKHHLDHLTDYAIDYFKKLKEKYGKGRERKTEIRTFDTIDAQKVAVRNTKFYANFKEGFIGTSLRKDEYVFDCSDIDDVIVFLKNGTMKVVKVENKTFVGKDIIHLAVWKKKDKRTIYNMIYRSGKKGPWYIKRFAVTSITRNNDYNLANDNTDSEVTYFSANPNGEAEVVQVLLKPSSSIRKLKWDIDFADIAIKGRNSRGNQVTKNAVKKVTMKEEGSSTLAPRKIWFDDSVNRLNVEGRGTLLGAFKGGDKVLTVTADGVAQLKSTDLSQHFEEEYLVLQKWVPEEIISCIYYSEDKKRYFLKRFELEDTLNPQIFYEEEDPKSFIEWVSTDQEVEIEVHFSKVKGKVLDSEVINVQEFIDVKGIKAQGNTLTKNKIKSIDYRVLATEEEETSRFETSELEDENNGDNTEGEATQGTLDFD